jgi:hypothetical protein
MREVMGKRDGEVGDTIRVLREKDEKIKHQRGKKKALQRELAELKSQVQAT